MRPTKAAEFTVREQESADSAPLVTRCAFCRWTFTGTAAEGRERAAQHRRKHPQAVYKKRNTRSLSSFRMRDLSEEQQREINDEREKRAYLIGLDL